MPPQIYEWFVLAAAGVLIVIGFAYLAMRRRDEILEDIFTPVEPELAQEFFKRIEAQERKKAEPPEESPPEVAPIPEATEWGDLPPGV